MAFFEGAEKLLEVWFGRSSDNGPVEKSLRVIGHGEWEKLLTGVKCRIISKKSSEDTDAYLLSESSMFVSSNRFILKTCGRTTLLPAIPQILQLVQTFTDFDQVVDLFYSHKKFEKPELQEGPHRSFYDEVEFLDQIFDNGAAFVLGRMNHDPWHMYTLEPSPGLGIARPDQTVEVLMSRLSSAGIAPFLAANSCSGEVARKASGLDRLWPEAVVVDDYLFEPCGYSVNVLLPNDCYVSMHITPENDFSYVSFETNLPMDDYKPLIKRMIEIFEPGEFLVTICANECSVALSSPDRLKRNAFSGYKRQDTVHCLMKNYLLYYGCFVRSNLS